MVFSRHIRELTAHELGSMLLTAGLVGDMVVEDTEPWPGSADPNLEKFVREILEQLDFNTGRNNPAWRLLRGTCFMILAGKSPPLARKHKNSEGFWAMARANSRAKRSIVLPECKEANE